MKKQLYVVDNFYTNAMQTREFILSQPFGTKGNFPGRRTKSYATQELKTHFEKIIQKNITYWPNGYNGAFQINVESQKSWIHRDETDWAGVLYLTPDAPLNAGTTFYRHEATKIDDREQYLSASYEIQKQVDADSGIFKRWDIIDEVGNVFNRLILFRGTRNHKSGPYFGSNKLDGRLIQLFFFNTGGENQNQNQNRRVPRPIMSPKAKFCILIFSTSRYEFLIPTLRSFYELVDFSGFEKFTIFTCDYPKRRDPEKIKALSEKYGFDQVILNRKNEGYSVSWRNAWRLVPNDTDFIFHLEEDFTFNKPIIVKKMVRLLTNPIVDLFQVFLKRQPVFEENDYVKDVESGKIGWDVNLLGQDAVLCNAFFNSNPGVYPYWITKIKLPFNPQEGVIIAELKKLFPSGHSAIFGKRNDPPLLTHTGVYNQGKKILKNEPGWSYLKHYDPEKKYVSHKFLELYEPEPEPNHTP